MNIQKKMVTWFDDVCNMESNWHQQYQQHQLSLSSATWVRHLDVCQVHNIWMTRMTEESPAHRDRDQGGCRGSILACKVRMLRMLILGSGGILIQCEGFCGKTTEFGNSKVPDLASKFFGWMVCCQISLKQCQLQAKEGSFLIVSREQSFVGRNEMEMNDGDLLNERHLVIWTSKTGFHHQEWWRNLINVLGGGIWDLVFEKSQSQLGLNELVPDVESNRWWLKP
jgi:hypothetical protein